MARVWVLPLANWQENPGRYLPFPSLRPRFPSSRHRRHYLATHSLGLDLLQLQELRRLDIIVDSFGRFDGLERLSLFDTMVRVGPFDDRIGQVVNNVDR